LTRGVSLADFGIELSKGFRGLRVWMSLKEHGVLKHGRIIEQNVDQVQFFGELVEASSVLELMAPVPSNCACFRYVGEGIDEGLLDGLNKELLGRVMMSGEAIISDTKIGGRVALRLGNVNHRSTMEDFRFLVDELIRIGNNLSKEL
jgi:aromatic-L-amino-acid decarboxylase